MDATLENISAALYNGILPQEWAKLAPDTRKTLGGWIEHFEKRIQQYNSWVSRQNSQLTDLPKKFADI